MKNHVSTKAYIRVKAHYTVEGVLAPLSDVVTVPLDYTTGEVHKALAKMFVDDNILIDGKTPKIKSVFLILPE